MQEEIEKSLRIPPKGGVCPHCVNLYAEPQSQAVHTYRLSPYTVLFIMRINALRGAMILHSEKEAFVVWPGRFPNEALGPFAPPREINKKREKGHTSLPHTATALAHV